MGVMMRCTPGRLPTEMLLEVSCNRLRSAPAMGGRRPIKRAGRAAGKGFSCRGILSCQNLLISLLAVALWAVDKAFRAEL